MALSSPLSIERAVAAGQETWQLVLSSWGDLTFPAGDTQTLLFPQPTDPRLPSFVSAAIDPQSDVDRVQIRYNSDAGLAAATSKVRAVWELSRRHPLLFPIYGPMLFDAFLTNQVTGTPAAGGTIYPATFRPFGSGAAAPFGSAMPAGVFVAPTLRVRLYLRGPLLGGVNGHRNLALYTRQHVFAGIMEELVWVVPAFGRRIAIFYGVAGAVGVTWRVTGVARTSVLGDVLSETATLAGPQVLGAFEANRLSVSDPPDFLIVRATGDPAAPFNLSVDLLD